jgi:hypothetical protein
VPLPGRDRGLGDGKKLTQAVWPDWPTTIKEEARQNGAGPTSSRGEVAAVSA